MDPEKIEKALAGAAKALGLEEGADVAQLMKRLEALATFMQSLESDPAPEEGAEPAPEAAATREDTDAVEASADDDEALELEIDDSDTIEASLDPSLEVELEDPGTDPLAGEAQAAVAALAEASGMAPEEVVAALMERRDEFAALLGGAPDSGTPAEEPPMMAADSDTALKASKARSEALTAQLAERDEKLSKLEGEVKRLGQESDAKRIDAAIMAKEFFPRDRELLLSLSRSNREEFETHMSRAAENPAYGDPIVAGKNPPVVDTAADLETEEMRTKLTRTFKSAGIKDIEGAVERALKSTYAGRA